MQDLIFSVRQSGEVTIIELSGGILFGESSSELFLNLRSLVKAGKRHLVIDLEQVTAVDAGGIGVLVGAHVELAKAAGGMRLVNVERNVLKLLRIGGLDGVFEIFNDRRAAVADFWQPDTRLDIAAAVKGHKVQRSSVL